MTAFLLYPGSSMFLQGLAESDLTASVLTGKPGRFCPGRSAAERWVPTRPDHVVESGVSSEEQDVTTERIAVLTYDGYKTEERPVEFRLGETRLVVQMVLDRWYEPEGTYFKVKADDGNLYILNHSFNDGWTLVAFSRQIVH